jgi:thiamine-phosphate pyrophosphorylase
VIQCAITDRRTLPDGVPFLSAISRNLAAGVDWIQIREKDLSARDLLDLVRSVLAQSNPRGVKILVNTRIDVALAAGASGAHLPSGSPAARAWRAMTPPGFLLGVSCHSPEEVRAAAGEGADYVFFGPVFSPLSKPAQSPPVGLGGLARAVAAAAKIPVLALGGITRANAAACIEAGAAGVAGISLYRMSTPTHPLRAW